MTMLSGTVSLTTYVSDAAATLKLLSNEQRFLLLLRISKGETHVGALVQKTGLPQSSVSQHLARLREGGLVATRREGTVIFYRLAHPAIAVLMHMLNAYFTQRNNRAQ